MVVVSLAACYTAQEGHHLAKPPVKQAVPEPLPLFLRASLDQAPPPLETAAQQGADAVTALIEGAEALYQGGVDDYRSGKMEDAKEHFDQALALLLESGLDVEAEERLNAECERLIENIHGLELAALEHGDGLGAHRYEPPPIESFAGLTFPVDPKVKEQVEQELQSVHSDLPLVSNEYVDGVIGYLQNHGRHYVQAVLERRGTYEPMISESLRQEGLPQDLIYLAAGESAFNPFALSRKGAKGIWQFMPGTAQLYGLRMDRWIDDREDPLKSTRAAARHLKDLYRTFGDWFLAMCAYDWNPAGVQHAIESTGYADFWTLRKLHAMPQETENYVPIFLATALIAKDPKAYGFEVPADPPAPPEQTVVAVPTDLRLVAQLIDRPVEALIQLNPSLQQWTTPPNDPQFVLRLPAGTKDLYEQAIASVPPDLRLWWRAHKVEAGETVESVAKKFHVSPAALAQVNQIQKDIPPELGARLLVPLPPGDGSSLTRVRSRAPLRRYSYRVRAGDTMELIADRFDVTPYQIRRWNHLTNQRLISGKILTVYAPAPTSSQVSNRRPATGKQTSHPTKIAKKSDPRTGAGHRGGGKESSAVSNPHSPGAL